MAYPSFIGRRYLQSRKKRSISAIGKIAIAGVALGVASLSVVISISSGFQDEFTKKVLGVNAHVLVMKYGLNYTEYREVMDKVSALGEVRGVAPFVIREMMISKGQRSVGVLLKGVDPVRMYDVLDLPTQITQGTLEGLRVPGSSPPAGSGYTAGRHKSALARIEEILEPVDAGPETAREEAALADGGADGPADETDEPAAPPTEPVPGIVLGQTLAENLGAVIGDQVQITSPMIGLDSLGWSPSESTPRNIVFKVIGIFYAGFLEYDTRLAYVDYYQAQRFMDQGDSVTGVEVTLHDYNEAKRVSKQIRQILGNGPYNLIDWEVLNAPLFTALKMQKVVLTVVLAVIIGVAAFNIIATLVMMVFDKRREIAILKSMGATRAAIARIFVHVGTVVGLTGLTIGLFVGFGACLLLREVGWPLDPEVYLVDHLPVQLDLVNFVITAAVAFLICQLATILPSLSASRYHPVDGLRQD